MAKISDLSDHSYDKLASLMFPAAAGPKPVFEGTIDRLELDARGQAVVVSVSTAPCDLLRSGRD